MAPTLYVSTALGCLFVNDTDISALSRVRSFAQRVNVRFGWKRNLLALSLVVVATSALLLTNNAKHGPYVTVELPVPEKHRAPWDISHDTLADRLVRGYGLDAAVAGDFAVWILDAAADNGLDPELIASLIRTESRFDVNARSHTGAVGPAQIQPAYWSEFCDDLDLDSAGQNIACGARILTHLIANSASESDAIKSYYAGNGFAADERLANASTVYFDQIVRNRGRLGHAL